MVGDWGGQHSLSIEEKKRKSKKQKVKRK